MQFISKIVIFQGLRMDFSNFLPPKIAQRMLGTVLTDSLSVLVVRFVKGWFGLPVLGHVLKHEILFASWPLSCKKLKE